MREIPANLADNDLVFHDQRRCGDIAATLPRVVDTDLPKFTAGLLIERYQKVIRRAEKHLAVANGNTTVLKKSHAARPRVSIFVLPYQAAICSIQCEYLKAGSDDVHDAVNNNWRGLQVLAVVSSLEDPCRREIPDVRIVDRAISVLAAGPADLADLAGPAEPAGQAFRAAPARECCL